MSNNTELYNSLSRISTNLLNMDVTFTAYKDDENGNRVYKTFKLKEIPESNESFSDWNISNDDKKCKVECFEATVYDWVEFLFDKVEYSFECSVSEFLEELAWLTEYAFEEEFDKLYYIMYRSNLEEFPSACWETHCGWNIGEYTNYKIMTVSKEWDDERLGMEIVGETSIISDVEDHLYAHSYGEYVQICIEDEFDYEAFFRDEIRDNEDSEYLMVDLPNGKTIIGYNKTVIDD